MLFALLLCVPAQGLPSSRIRHRHPQTSHFAAGQQQSRCVSPLLYCAAGCGFAVALPPGSRLSRPPEPNILNLSPLVLVFSFCLPAHPPPPFSQPRPPPPPCIQNMLNSCTAKGRSLWILTRCAQKSRLRPTGLQAPIRASHPSPSTCGFSPHTVTMTV